VTLLGRAAKRALDLTLATTGLAVLSPVLAGAALAIRATMGAPVLFRQRRPGQDGRVFELYKLRTMRDGALPDDQRLTRLGAFLRASSIDELPELWNVLRGEMSLVGPRPLLVEYLARYSERQARRHEVKPGLTGWAQIRGRNAISWDRKLELDVWYVDHQSLWLDLRILAETVWTVLKREGISASGHATMPVFMGEGL
jgi:lipopolysaccharide/colanic/teichoic acid biosynthesis glycosyltransferase